MSNTCNIIEMEYKLILFHSTCEHLKKIKFSKFNMLKNLMCEKVNKCCYYGVYYSEIDGFI